LFTNMESEWKDEDCFKLTALYELNMVLYDPSDRNYRNRELKRQKESEIATALGKPGKNVHAVTYVCIVEHSAASMTNYRIGPQICNQSSLSSTAVLMDTHTG